MTPAKLRLAQAAMAKRDTKVGELCKELAPKRGLIELEVWVGSMNETALAVGGCLTNGIQF